MSSPESLLEHATWLRRLAAGLVGDRALADDVVQDTWVAALRRPPDLDRPVRPWLARVVRNAARFRWRSDANRTAREAAIGLDDEATPSSDELLARHELQQLLARLVGELDEPFRGTILLCYAEGLAPAQIARRLGIPASTVRSRVREGLERLRRGLDAAHGGDRKRWLLALAPIALWPRASHAAPATVPAAGLGVAIVLAAAGVAAIVIAGRSSHPVRPQLIERVTTSSTPTAHRAATAIPAGWQAQEGVAPRHVAGRVVRDGAPVADALVRLTSEARPAIERRTDFAGRFDFDAQDARAITLGAAVPETLAAIAHVDLRDPTLRTDEIELVLQPCVAAIEGKITDAGGNPIAHAQVLREDAIGTETDASGHYALCTKPTAALVAQLDVAIRADGYGAIAIGIAAAGRVRRDFVLTPEAVITGQIDPPSAGAEVWIEPERLDLRPATQHAARLTTVTDGDGRFRIAGASGGSYRLGGAGRGTTARVTVVAVEAGGSAEVTLHLMAAAIVRGHLDAHGAPVAGVRVAVRPAGQWNVVVRHDDAARDPIIAGDAITQADGTFVLDGVPLGQTRFTASPLRLTTDVVTIAAGENRVALDDIDLAWGGRIAGTVVDASGRPLAAVHVRFTGPRGEVGRCATDAAGAFSCGQLAGGVGYRGAVYPGDDATRPFPMIGTEPRIDLADGDATVTGVRLAIDPLTAAIAGMVVDEVGAPIVDAHVRAWGAGIEHDGWSPAPATATDANGRFQLAQLAPGDYELEAETLDGTRHATHVFTAGARDATLVIARPTCLAGAPLDPAHKPAGPIVWDDRIELVGWDLPATAKKDQPFEIALVFRVRAPVSHAWKMFVHLDGTFRRNADHEPLAGKCPTSTWRPGDLLVDRFTTELPTTGPSRVAIGFFTQTNGDGPWQDLTLSAVPDAMRVPVDGVELGTVHVD